MKRRNGFFGICTLCICAFVLSACGGSMGADPSSGGSSAPSSTNPSGGTPPNNPPAASAPAGTNGSLASVMGAPSTGTLSGQGAGTLTYAISTQPQDGTATLTNATTGAFTYTSYPNFTGQDNFQFTVTNSNGTSQPATETLNVTSSALGAEQTVANIGVSLDWLCYWCVVQPYVDIVHQASVFTDATTGVPLMEEGKLDANGWPEADFRWMVICCIKADGSATDPGPASPLAGAYQLSFTGKATISPLTFALSNQQYNAATNTTTATLTLGPNYQGGNAMLTFTNTQQSASAATDTGVTNIQIIRPQFAPNGTKWWDSPTQEFTDPFLDSLKGFSTARYINFTGSINSPEVNWSDRTPDNWPVASHLEDAPTSSLSYLVPNVNCGQYCDWYATGASWGSVIAISNASHTDPWINIPVMASDDYVKSLAALFKAKLDPGLHVYVEWSDEIWNYGDPYWTETNYANDQVKALIANNPTEATNYTNNCDSWDHFECYVAERVMQFGNDFASVYGQAAINTTIRPVLCTQVVQPIYLQSALQFIALTYGPPKNYFYGICGAPYWGASALPAGTTTAGAVAALNKGITGNNVYIYSDTATALFYGLHNFTYEGGPVNANLAFAAGSSSVPAPALNASVQMAPGMKANVINGLTNAFANGIDMYMFYENQSATYWGATTDPVDLNQPKFAGLAAMPGQPVTRTVGTMLPGTIPVDPPDLTISNGIIPTAAWKVMFCSNGGCALKGAATPGTGFGYLVNVPKAGNYSVSLVLSPNSTPAASIALDVDLKPAGSFTVPQSPGGTPLTVGPVSVSLTSGLHLIEILQVGTYNFAANSIVVAAN